MGDAMKELEFISSMSFDSEHALMHKVVGEDIYREAITPINRVSGKFGNPKVYWYHKDDKNTHSSYKDAAAFAGRQS